MRARPPIDLDKRRIFSMPEKREICRAQVNERGEIPCAICGEICALFDGNNWTALRGIEFDHEHAHALGGQTIAENGRVVCKKTCHRILTGQTIRAVNKADSAGGRIGQRQRRMAAKRAHRWPKQKLGGFHG